MSKRTLLVVLVLGFILAASSLFKISGKARSGIDAESSVSSAEARGEVAAARSKGFTRDVPKTATEKAEANRERDELLSRRLANPKLEQLVRMLGQGSLSALKSKEDRTKFEALSKQVASHGKEAERMMREAFMRLDQREMSIARLAILETALVGKMDPAFLRELGERELELSAGIENGKQPPMAVRQFRSRLMGAAAAAYVSGDVPFVQSAELLEKTLAREADPIIRVSILRIYMMRYPGHQSSIKRMIASN